MQQLQNEFEVSERRAEVVDQPRSTQRYEPSPRDDEAALTNRMLELANARPRFANIAGLHGCFVEGWQASDMQCYRLWRREGPRVPQKKW
ncbi:MAG: hypothetical protein R3C02_06205 [Planctomycetaceae bacterium]